MLFSLLFQNRRGQGPGVAQGLSKGSAAGRVDGAVGGHHLHRVGSRGGSAAPMLREDQGRPDGVDEPSSSDVGWKKETVLLSDWVGEGW